MQSLPLLRAPQRRDAKAKIRAVLDALTAEDKVIVLEDLLAEVFDAVAPPLPEMANLMLSSTTAPSVRFQPQPRGTRDIFTNPLQVRDSARDSAMDSHGELQRLMSNVHNGVPLWIKVRDFCESTDPRGTFSTLEVGKRFYPDLKPTLASTRIMNAIRRWSTFPDPKGAELPENYPDVTFKWLGGGQFRLAVKNT